MAYPLKLSSLLVGSLAAMGVVVAAPAVLAQNSGTDPTRVPVVDTNAGFSGSDSRGGGIFGDASSPMDLLHRAVLMNEMSLTDFSRQHQGRMSDQINNFNILRQEALQQQPGLRLEPEADNVADPNPL
jgi:hypothetical protein